MEIKDIYDKYAIELIDKFECLAISRCCWNCRKRNKSCCDCRKFYNERDLVVMENYIEHLEKQNKEIRKQVCDEIKKKFGYKYNKQLVVSSYQLCKFLDQIEKGEIKK